MNRTILDLGCGTEKADKSFIGIDISEKSDADIVFDLNLGIPFEDSSVDGIYAIHFLEHVDFEFMTKEIYRVLKVGGFTEIEIPYFTHPHTYFPLHRIPGVSLIGMLLYMKECEYYTDVKFVVDRFWFAFPVLKGNIGRINGILTHIFDYVAWRKPLLYDMFLSRVFPASALRFIMRKVK